MIDYKFSALDSIDGFLALALPQVLRIWLWGAVAGSASILIYAKVSSQDKFTSIKHDNKKSQHTHTTYMAITGGFY